MPALQARPRATDPLSPGYSGTDFLRIVGAPPGELVPPDPLAVPVRVLENAYFYAERHDPIIASAYAPERISRA